MRMRINRDVVGPVEEGVRISGYALDAPFRGDGTDLVQLPPETP